MHAPGDLWIRYADKKLRLERADAVVELSNENIWFVMHGDVPGAHWDGEQHLLTIYTQGQILKYSVHDGYMFRV